MTTSDKNPATHQPTPEELNMLANQVSARQQIEASVKADKALHYATLAGRGVGALMVGTLMGLGIIKLWREVRPGASNDQTGNSGQ